jgi:hypothetical protein
LEFLNICHHLQGLTLAGCPASFKAGYRATVRRLLPNLITLDDIPVAQDGTFVVLRISHCLLMCTKTLILLFSGIRRRVIWWADIDVQKEYVFLIFCEEENVEHREKLIDKEAEKGRYKGAEGGRYR